MNAEALTAVSRGTLVLAVAVTATAGLVWGGAGMLAAGVGAALACANLWAIRRLASKAVRRVLAEGRGAAALGAGLMLKMLVLFAVVYAAVVPLGLAIAPFALGVSLLVAAPVLGGLYLALREEA